MADENGSESQGALDALSVAAEWRKLSTLHPWPDNPRVNTQAVEPVASNVIALGWGAPLIAWTREDGKIEIIGGHTRHKAAKLLIKRGAGADWHPDAIRVATRKEVPVRLVQCTAEVARKLALADNRLGEIASWDDRALLDALSAMTEAEAALVGWQTPELDALIDRVSRDVQEAADNVATTSVRAHERATHRTGDQEAQDREPEDDVAPAIGDAAGVDVLAGDVYQIGDHFLMCGDSTSREDVATLLATRGQLADMVWSDPPYGVNVSSKGGRAIAGDIGNAAIAGFFPVALESLKDGHGIYVCGGSTNVPLYFKLFEIHTRMLPKMITWVKNGITLRHYDYHSRTEFVYYGWRGAEGSRPEDRWFGDRKQTDVWEIKRDASSTYIHPTQKPVALAARAIVNSSPMGGVVFDPFAGSGSSLIACQETQRVCLTMEIDPACVDAILRRYETRYGVRGSLVHRE